MESALVEKARVRASLTRFFRVISVPPNVIKLQTCFHRRQILQLAAMSLLEVLWTGWFQLWRSVDFFGDYLGMGMYDPDGSASYVEIKFNNLRLIVMAIFWSQILVKYLLKKFHRNQTSGITWRSSFMALDFALEFPAVYIYLPSIRLPPRIDVMLSSIPSFIDVFQQICILLIVERICQRIIPSFGRPGDHDSTAAELSVEFIMPRVTLLLCIPLLENSLLEMSSVGRLHFISVVGWLMVSTLLGAGGILV